MTDSVELGPVKQWSFSRLSNFETCPMRVYLAAVKKEKQPERDADNPAERGTRIHQTCEDFVNGKGDKLKEVDPFWEDDLETLREEYSAGTVELEGDWGFDIDWQATGWWDENVWARIKLDAFRRLDETTARVIDYKTGKKFGNEVHHTQQAQLYMVAAFMKYPEIDLIETEFFYLDQKDYMKKTYPRSKLPLYLKKFTERAMKLTTATEFPAKPTKMNCRWCDYGPENGTGACPYGVPMGP